MATASSLLSPLHLCVSSSSHGYSSVPLQFSSLFLFYPLFSPFYHFIGPSSFNLYFSLPSFLHLSLLSLPPLCSQLWELLVKAWQRLHCCALSASVCVCVCVCVCVREICQHPLLSSRGFVKERQADSNWSAAFMTRSKMWFKTA